MPRRKSEEKPVLPPLLRVVDVEKYYRISRQRRRILDNVNLDVRPGEIVALTGKSGCGKTTLLNIITGLTAPSKGYVEFEGRKIFYLLDIVPSFIRNRRMGFIFQTFRLLYNETVASNILMPARIRGIAGREVSERMDSLLVSLGIADHRNMAAGLLSGGQKQRVAIARALINNPPFILADEPTANLDKDTSLEIFQILEKFAREENKAILIVTHKDYMLSRADRAFNMIDGRLEVLK